MRPTYRYVIEIDFDHVEDGSTGEPLPESRKTYDAAPYMKDGRPLPYAAYLATYGNPDRYTGYYVGIEKQCPCCAAWTPIEAVGTSLYDGPDCAGTYATLDAIPDPHLRELAAELTPEAES